MREVEDVDGSGAIELPRGPLRRLYPLVSGLRRRSAEAIYNALVFAVQKKNSWTTFGCLLEGTGVLVGLYALGGIPEQDSMRFTGVIGAWSVAIGGANIAVNLSPSRYRHQPGRVERLLGTAEAVVGAASAAMLFSGNRELYSPGFMVAGVVALVTVSHLIVNSPRDR